MHDTHGADRTRSKVIHRLLCFLVICFLVICFAPISISTQPSAGSGGAIYRAGWIDFNKNGRKDVYEDPKANINARIENLLRQMTLDEKTCQTATLYGYNRVLKDELPTPNWKNKIWKDGIANIDEHLNGWGQSGSQSVYANDIKKHVWAMNEVQRFF